MCWNDSKRLWFIILPAISASFSTRFLSLFISSLLDYMNVQFQVSCSPHHEKTNFKFFNQFLWRKNNEKDQCPFEKSSWKNQVPRTRFLVYFKLDFYCLCSLQKSISKFELDFSKIKYRGIGRKTHCDWWKKSEKIRNSFFHEHIR